jgi:hypothetical protein
VGAVMGGGMYDVLVRPDGTVGGVAVVMVLRLVVVVELIGWAHSGARGSDQVVG